MEEWKEYRLEKLTIGKGEYGIGASAVPLTRLNIRIFVLQILMMMEL